MSVSSVVALLAYVAWLIALRPAAYVLLAAALARAPRPPGELWTAAVNGWGGGGTASVMLSELFVFNAALARERGLMLVPFSEWVPLPVAAAAADALLVSGYGPRGAIVAAAAANPRAAVVFVLGENPPADGDADGSETMLMGVADASFGPRADLEGARVAGAPAAARARPRGSGAGGGNSASTAGGRSSAAGIGGGAGAAERPRATAYVRVPWWLPYTVDRASPRPCHLPEALSAPGEPAGWATRPGFAAFLASHGGYPREELFGLLSRAGRVDAPGRAFHNTEWPADLPNDGHTGAGKIALLRRYRFALAPENSRSTPPGSATPGYATEKLPHAHLAGAVPVYWGDALDAAVWDARRVLVYNGSNGDALLRQITVIDRDAAARATFFSVPPLAPTAQGWVDEWCARAGAALGAAVDAAAARRAAAGEPALPGTGAGGASVARRGGRQ